MAPPAEHSSVQWGGAGGATRVRRAPMMRDSWLAIIDHPFHASSRIIAAPFAAIVIIAALVLVELIAGNDRGVDNEQGFELLHLEPVVVDQGSASASNILFLLWVTNLARRGGYHGMNPIIITQ
jgi:hypothetical protein